MKYLKLFENFTELDRFDHLMQSIKDILVDLDEFNLEFNLEKTVDNIDDGEEKILDLEIIDDSGSHIKNNEQILQILNKLLRFIESEGFSVDELDAFSDQYLPNDDSIVSDDWIKLDDPLRNSIIQMSPNILWLKRFTIYEN